MTVNKEYITLAASGTRSTDHTYDVQTSHGVGATVVVDVSNIVSGSIVATIQGKDLVSGKYYDILSSAAILAAGTKVLTVYPSVTVASNLTASQPLPLAWALKITMASGTAAYTAGVSIID